MRRALLASLGAVTVLAAACGDSAKGTERGLVGAPDVVGRPQAEAYCRLEAAGLRWRTGGEFAVHSRVGNTRAPDPRAGGLPPAGPADPCGPSRGFSSQAEVHVLEQWPSAGARVARGTIVRLEDGCTMLRALGTACL